MIFDLEKASKLESDGQWFPFFESHVNEKGEVIYGEPKPDSGKVLIRTPEPFIDEKMAKRKRRYEFALNPLTRAMERVGYFVEETPEQAQKNKEDLWDYIIMGWEGFVDAHGTVIECTRENKLKVMKILAFDRFLGHCLKLMADAEAEAKEGLVKN